MPGKVVVGYVDDEGGRDALALGGILAKAREAELAFLTVAESEELASAAREQGADLVVLGSTHGRHLGLNAPGATMEGVLADAGCPVAIAPRGFAVRADRGSVWLPLDGDDEDVGMRVVGVGFDGTAESRTALELATDLALDNGAALRVYTVIGGSGSIAPGTTMTPTSTATTVLDRGRAELHETVGKLPGAVRAQPVLLHGLAVDELIGASELGVDLLVLGTHLGGQLHRRFHKSVAGLVAGNARCPVLICPSVVAAPVAAPA